MPSERAFPRAAVAAVALVAVLGATRASFAAPADRAAARQHLARAEELKKQGQLRESCKHLEEAERLDSNLKVLMALAECVEQSGDLVAAEQWWERARDRAKKDEKPQSRSRAESHLSSVQKRVARLTLQLAAAVPAGTQVFRGETAIDVATLGSPQAVNPGEHVIVVKVADHEDAKYSVKLADGESQTLPIAPGPARVAQVTPPVEVAAPLPPPSPPPVANTAAAVQPKDEAPPPAGWWTGPRTVGVISGLAGLVGVGLGSALVFSAKDASATNRGKALGAVALATGGVLVISGIALVVTAPSEGAQQAQNILPALLAVESGAVVSAAGSF